MDRLEADKILVKGSVEDLSAYLDSDELFWPLSTPGSGARNTITLTIGNLLLSMEQLRAFGKAQDIEDNIRAIMAIKESRKTVWTLKSAREIVVRTNLWQVNLNRILKDTKKDEFEYSEIIKDRVLVELLKIQLVSEKAAFEVVKSKIPKIGISLNLLDELDTQLKTFPSGEFVWDKRLVKVFPRTNYWFLYMDPSSGKGGQ